MNIAYAVKIFVALAIVLFAMRLIAGRGLRLVMTNQDWEAGWIVIAGTLVVSCFSWRVPLFFLVFSAWTMYVPRLFGKSSEGRLPAYALIACISPQFSFELENIGPLKDVLGLSPLRILEMFILLPEALRLLTRRERPQTPSWLRLCDLATLGYFIYWTLRLYGNAPVSTVAREMVQGALDTVLPYYVLSRACVPHQMRRRVMSMVLFGAVYQGFVGLAESLSRHFLYAQLQYLYDARWGLAEGLTRGSLIRAQAAFGGPLILAVLLLFGIGLWFALKPTIKSRPYAVVGGVLFAGLLATLSRGPILAMLVLVIGVALLRFVTARKFLLLSLVIAIALTVSWNLGLGDSVVALISSVSGDDKTADFNVTYRQQLLTMSLALIQQAPWWGVPNYIQQMESLRQGEGIIDLVNTYLVVTLNVGVFGLALFLLPFVLTLWRQASSIPAEPAEARRESLVWLPLTLAVMAAVFTVSPVSIIGPILVWTVALALARLQEGLPLRPRLGATLPAPARAG